MTQATLERPRGVVQNDTLVEPKLVRLPVPEIDSMELRVTRFQRERTPELYNEIAREMLPLVRARATAIHARSGFASVVPRDLSLIHI